MRASHDYNPDAPERSLVADTVLQGRYLIVRQLGRGGMGAVYEAVDQRLGITVALKETLSSEVSMRKQFEREARLLAGMQHPALPRVSDHFVEGNRAFLVMQFIGGVDLAKIISQQPGPFPRDQVIAWADQLLDALIYLHSRDRQVIHRDIKPHNLKLTTTGQIALLDFGLAKAQPADSSNTSSQAFFGYTRHYAPLEQIQDQHTDPRSDIYALGATLYHLLTGIKPPDAMVRASATVNSGPDPLKSANEIHAAVGPQIAAILNKALAQRPEDRYADALEFREALRRMGRTKEASRAERDLSPAGVGRSAKGKEARGAAPRGLPGTIHISEAPLLSLISSARALPNGRGSARNPSSAPEPPMVNLALVGSARRFGPAGATAILGLVVTLAGGIIYGANRWFPANGEVISLAPSETTKTNPAASLRSGAAIRKSERPRAVDNVEVVAAKTRNLGDTSTAARASEKKNAVVPTKSAVEKKLAAFKLAPSLEKRMRGAKSQAVFNRPEPLRAAPRKDTRRVGAPNIRFPNLDFRDNTPAPSPDARVRTFGASYVLPKSSSNAAPKFYRAADGTQIVKFSDGSTQFVRPGHQSGQQ